MGTFAALIYSIVEQIGEEKQKAGNFRSIPASKLRVDFGGASMDRTGF
jgi:hypothetical protein